MTVFLSDNTLTLNTAVQVNTNGYALDAIDWIELQNASPYACKVKIGNQQVLIPAWYDYPIPCALYTSQGTRRILPGIGLPFSVTPYLQTIPGSGFTQTLHTILYIKGETPASTVPQPLGGSPVNLSIATSVVNTNDPAGTAEVFLIPHGDANPAGATRVYNNAEIILGDAAYMGILSLIMNGGDSFLLEANGLTQTDSTGTNLWVVDDAGNFLLGNANHSGQAQITDGTNTTIITPTQVQPGGSGTVHNGSVSGTCTLYTPIWGSSLKLIMLVFNNYQSAASFTFTLPGTITFGNLLSGNFGAETVTPQLNGVNSTGSAITALASSGGTFVGITAIDKGIVGELAGATNQLLISSNAAAVSRMLLIIGV